MSKATMQEIAQALSTSRVTVWKALNDRPGVSEALRAQVRAKAEELGYFTPAVASTPPHTRTVAVVVSRPESSIFWMQIIHQLAKELSQQGVNLMYIYLPTHYQPNYNLPPVLLDGTLEGIVVLNITCPTLLQMLAALPSPKVFLDTVPSVPYSALGGDLVLIEGRAAVRHITGRLLDAGYQRLGFIGDIAYAQTNTDRYKGFLDAHARRGLTVEHSLCRTSALGLQTHYEEICAFLDALPTMPQAIVCMSDYIAHFVQRYFDEERRPGCDGILLTGFDNNTEYANVAGLITTVDVQTGTLGCRLAARLLFRIAHPEASHEVSYINSEILYRGPLAGQ